MRFIWNDKKSAANFKKHGVSFEEATTIFADPLAGTFPDSDHSIDESRLITIGVSCNRRLLVVAHTESAVETRIISARLATTREKKSYES